MLTGVNDGPAVGADVAVSHDFLLQLATRRHGTPGCKNLEPLVKTQFSSLVRAPLASRLISAGPAAGSRCNSPSRRCSSHRMMLLAFMCNLTEKVIVCHKEESGSSSRTSVRLIIAKPGLVGGLPRSG